MLYSVIAISSLVTLLQQSVRKPSLICLGFFAGLIAWNSQDFGVAVAVAYGIVLQIATRGGTRKRATILWLSGLVLGVLLYPLCTLAIGHPIQLKYLALSARSFGNGVFTFLIQIPGPVLLVLPVILGSAATGWCLLWRASTGTYARPRHQQYAVVTLAFVGSWSVISFPYYINESSASAQLQIFLLPFGVCCCALLSLCLAAVSKVDGRFSSDVRLYLRRSALWLLPVTLPIAVGFGAILQTPYPAASLDALEHPSPSIGFLDTAPTHEVAVAQTYVRSHGGGSLGYLGPDANYIKLSTGVQPRICMTTRSTTPSTVPFGTSAASMSVIMQRSG